MFVLRSASLKDKGFSLLELLVVIAIILLFLAILLPVISKIREASRSTACLANVQQWGYSYQMYVAGNHGRTLSDEGDYVADRRWWEWLAPYNGNVRVTLLCPNAREPSGGLVFRDGPHYIRRGSAVAAWAQDGQRGEIVGSYGINGWLYRPNGPKNPNPYIHFPVKEAAQIPILGDCVQSWTLAIGGGDLIPTNLVNPEPGVGVGNYCIDRHQMAVNLVFLDGHAEHVPLADLWRLKWSQRSVPRNVTVH